MNLIFKQSLTVDLQMIIIPDFVVSYHKILI